MVAIPGMLGENRRSNLSSITQLSPTKNGRLSFAAIHDATPPLEMSVMDQYGIETESVHQQVLELHAAGRINEAISLAKRALAKWPDRSDLLQYVGSTLVSRKRSYRAGLENLERALIFAPDDPDLLYTTGWCYEYAAHELARGRGGWDSEPTPSGEQLLAKAEWALRRSISLQTDPGMKDDAMKLLETITGEQYDSP
jgi:tetratricopeptide (TPR) repeat protein